MELRVLQYFLAVAREQSISAAAESLHLSQPTLSTQLKGLEEELGKQLLIRGSHGSRKVTLTEEGMLLRKRAEEIVNLVRKAEREISASDEVLAGDIHIGAGETQLIRLFAETAKDMREESRDVHFHMYSGNSVYVLEQLDKGLIDFGLIYGPVDKMKYDFLEMPRCDEFGVLMREDSRLAEKERISPEDLWDQPLIVSSQNLRGENETMVWLGRAPEQLDIVATYNLIFNASLLVDEGLGYAICFSGLVNTAGESSLCFRPLDPPLIAKASIVWKKYQVLPKAAQRFIQQLKDRFTTK